MTAHALRGLLAAIVAAGVVAGAFYALAGCSAAGPAATAAYATARLRCVEAHDAASTARECMRRVDRAYGQDGGL